MFGFKSNQNGQTVMTFESVSIKRFSVIFAFFLKKSWRLRLRLVVTLEHGIIAFPMTKTLFINNGKIEIPKEFEQNTMLLLGVHSEANEIDMPLRVYANVNGLLNENNFNGYECSIQWNRREDTMNVPDRLDCHLKKKTMFSLNLYDANGRHKVIGKLSEQRVVAPPIRYFLYIQY